MRTVQNVLLAFLNAAHTAYAHDIGRIHNLIRVEFALFVNVVNTTLALHALDAPQATVRLDDVELRYRVEPGGNCLNFHVILRWHIYLKLE